MTVKIDSIILMALLNPATIHYHTSPSTTIHGGDELDMGGGGRWWMVVEDDSVY